MFFKILSLFFFKKWRIWNYDYFILSAIWITLFIILIIYIFINIFSITAWLEYDSLVFISKISINITILLILFYSWYCLQINRAHDFWLSKLDNNLKNIIKQFKEWDKEENDFWKSEILFNFSYIVKLSSIIIFIALFLFINSFSFRFIDNKVERIYNSNISVIESKKKILNNSELKIVLWDKIKFWKISWLIINNKFQGSLSISYNIIWNNNKWLVKVEWKKEKWIWLITNIDINIWWKEYKID